MSLKNERYFQQINYLLENKKRKLIFQKNMPEFNLNGQQMSRLKKRIKRDIKLENKI
jgi:primosomal protein N'